MVFICYQLATEDLGQEGQQVIGQVDEAFCEQLLALAFKMAERASTADSAPESS